MHKIRWHEEWYNRWWGKILRIPVAIILTTFMYVCIIIGVTVDFFIELKRSLLKNWYF